MRNCLIIYLLLVLSAVTFAQNPPKRVPIATPSPTAKVRSENQEFQNARQMQSLTEKIDALKKFIDDYPNSSSRTFAQELLVSTRATLGDQKLSLSDNQAGIDLFKIAIIEAPMPISDKLFNEIVIQFPANLFYRNQQAEANEIAKLIEVQISGNVNQILGLSAFYLGTENGKEGKRLAEMAIELEPKSAAAYQALGFANRLNFDLDAAAAAYAKALELNPRSFVSKRNLAEMKRAVGKSDESALLFKEVLEATPEDVSAQNGFILSLLDSGKREEAEAELAKSLEYNPNNVFLLVGAGYWYAAHGFPEKAVEFSQKAISIEPRYSWAYIGLARGFLQLNRPLEAEHTLITAKQYGNFPTLNYELASARMAAGFFREAAEELAKSFNFKDDKVSVSLGGRVYKQGKSFTEILSFERQASIFEPAAADDPVFAAKLISLLKFSQAVDSAKSINDEISMAADEFISSEDKMKIHRSLFVAETLLDKKLGAAKVLEITESAASNPDAGLDVVSPAAAVMAQGLYESRIIASLRNEILVIPEIPRQTLSKILRGRIEELSGRALLQQNKPNEAAIKLKKAIGIFPEKSVWWRNSKWQLGDALEAGGNSEDALDEYVDAFISAPPDAAKRILIELIYAKIHGSTEGLDRLIGARTVAPTAAAGSVETSVPQNETSPTEITKTNSEIAASETESTKAAESTTVEDQTTAKSPANDLKLPENVPAIIPNQDVKPENVEVGKKVDLKKAYEPKTESANSVNPLFESIVIRVPNREKTSKPVDQPVAELQKTPIADAEKVESPENDTKLTNIEEPTMKPENKEVVEPVSTRLRVVPSADANTEREIETICSIKVGQERVSLLNDGGSLGMFVGYDGVGGDLSKILATSSSPADVFVEIQSDVGVLSERVFFVLKSISSKTGVFKVTFDSPCGKREVEVTVR